MSALYDWAGDAFCKREKCTHFLCVPVIFSAQ